jgi:broad specificity phosphatase PhoE
VPGRRLGYLVGEGRDGLAYVASPLERTRHTMEGLRTALGLDPRSSRPPRPAGGSASGRGRARPSGRGRRGAGRPRYVASPLERTRHTMEGLRTALGLDPAAYATDPRLVEIGITVGPVRPSRTGRMRASTIS